MSLAGALELGIGWDGNAVREVAIRSTRPVEATRILEGRLAQEALRTVPLLFSVCAQAQSAAAGRALEAADGVEAVPEPQMRDLAVLAEAVGEHLWRLLVELPRALGLRSDERTFAAVRRPLRAAASPAHWKTALGEFAGVLAERVFGRPLRDWRGMTTRAELMAWMNDAGTGAAASLRALSAQRWTGAAVAPLPRADVLAVTGELVPALETRPGFAREPLWRGAAAETGPYPRQYEASLVRAAREAGANPAFGRMLARLVELADWPLRMQRLAEGGPAPRWVEGATIRPGVGAGWTECARGVLVHLTQVNSGRVVRHMVISPTEWNFHPRGAFAKGLTGMQIGDRGELERRASLLACALDPCVAYRLNVRDA